jgi:LPXTG-site transpeptidase (sortase) family protein
MKFKLHIKRALIIITGLTLISALFFYSVSRHFIQSGLALSDNVLITSFGDVLSSHPNYEAINYLLKQKIIGGYPDGTYRPDSLINRAEFTKIITEAYYPGQAAGSDCFPDVGNEWFAKYVCFDKLHNFVGGYPDGSFKPADNINFAEIAKILVNLSGFPVTADAGVWYRPYIITLSELKAIPLSINSFDQKVTRGEMAEMVYRLRADVQSQPARTYDQLQAEQLSPGLPVRMQIPAINVDAVIEQVGLTPAGAVGIPQDPDNAAWYQLGPRPGEVGSSVITGHVNWYYGATGVFENLSKLTPGDQITIKDEKGNVMTFVVRESRSYDASADAVDVFFSSDGKAHLNLITCEGVWDSSAHQYTKRLVVFADRI